MGTNVFWNLAFWAENFFLVSEQFFFPKEDSHKPVIKCSPLSSYGDGGWKSEPKPVVHQKVKLLLIPHNQWTQMLINISNDH